MQSLIEEMTTGTGGSATHLPGLQSHPISKRRSSKAPLPQPEAIEVQDGQDTPTADVENDDVQDLEAIEDEEEDLASNSSSEDEFSDTEESDTAMVYMQEGVSIRPQPGEKIFGRLTLVERSGILFITWLPRNPQDFNNPSNNNPTSSSPPFSLGGDHSMPHSTDTWYGAYAVMPIPLSDVRAIRRDTPPLRKHKITVTLHNGVSFPPFHFEQGGAKGFISVLRSHVTLVPSEEDPRVLLVGDLHDPLRRSLACLELSDAVPFGAPGRTASSNGLGLGGGIGSTSATWSEEEEGVPLRQQLQELAERFQKFTKGARNVASSILAGSVILGGQTLEGHVGHVGQATLAAAGGGDTSTGAVVVDGGGILEKEEQAGGLGPGLNAAFFIDGVPEKESEASNSSKPTSAYPASTSTSAVPRDGSPSPIPGISPPIGTWEMVERSVSAELDGQLHIGWSRPKPPHLTLEELETLMDNEGRLIGVDTLRQRAYQGGVEPDARAEVWKWLLGIHPAASSTEERATLQTARRKRYVELRRQWKTITPDQAARFSKWVERQTRVDKDVRRTDRGFKFYAKEKGQSHHMLRNVLLSYVMYNFDLGYCQGMSDLAAPVLYAMQCALPDRHVSAESAVEVEAETFWAFAALMERMQGNFAIDCSGMHLQLAALRRLLQLLDPSLYTFLESKDATNLFFCYRWILILFKREFAFEQVLRLWDGLFSYPANHLHLFLCMAVLERQRRTIMEQDLDFDGLLALCVDLKGKIDLDVAMKDAVMLKEYAGEAGQEVVAGLPF